ncbi:MAG: bifunctional folylpolyglutamate synthase/dihydrofolate synthase [Actinobacteria bacterium]|nr:bifunctional folylpolyglutamate synthase/dihydrofolate synthase [Actinomycetota bacterium]MBT3746943.1 bifunctional folylpolyglutamate synthase/dihydrofolate synthase [Actinomycetota bacterium]MBT3970495.1 bifunctional folylpolyglutamate synthase/dihydrofolate synthase [Actinomycetota bacterium]MBT4008917.1 bifunctional folylpolyglutamate synthase/dihydrofolate synthase [Actinomycetota bacterium]MBT4302752.1 bifunctional folylpolyglutamate synthase/dihydrofolate synthase [Actinomycetota bact
MDYTAALRFLDRHINLEATAGRIHGLSLEAMEGLMQCMGDPQQDFRSIQVTGTNGKGSVSAITASLLQAAGLRVGVYSSPHVDTIRERLRIDGEMISEEGFGELVGQVELFAQSAPVPPSYFELLTAAAFLWFANEAVDVAIVEVGLLGRFDATNVLNGEVAVITNIGRDHTDGQEGWRRAIAEEKAGIIEAQRPLVLGETSVDVLDLFVAENPEPLLTQGESFGVTATSPAVGGQAVDLWTKEGTHNEIFLGLFGDHQAENAALALATAESFLGSALEGEVVGEGLAAVALPGRLEVAAALPLVILDGAHNPPAMRALVASVPEVFGGVRRTVVLGVLGPREPAEVVAELAALQPELVICCTAPSERAIDAEALARLVSAQGIDVEVVVDGHEAVRRALVLSDEDDLVLVTGSFYVLSAARQVLTEAE